MAQEPEKKTKTILGFTTSDPEQIEALQAIKKKHNLDSPIKDALIDFAAATAVGATVHGGRKKEKREATAEAEKVMEERWAYIMIR